MVEAETRREKLMLYSVALLIMCFLTPVCTILAFIIGFNINARADQKIGLKKKSSENGLQKIMDNIDRYDGTSKGQEEIK